VYDKEKRQMRKYGLVLRFSNFLLLKSLMKMSVVLLQRVKAQIEQSADKCK
jgi:hypothetical protein